MAEAILEKAPVRPPLTAISDDEQLFRDNVRHFAEERTVV